MSGAAIPLSLFPVTRSWTPYVDWNTYDGTHAWTARGGDFSGTPSYSAAGVVCCMSQIDWYPTAEPMLAPPTGRQWALLWSSEEPRYGGLGTPKFDGKNWRGPGHAAMVFRTETR